MVRQTSPVADEQVRANELAAAQEALGADVRAAATFRLRLDEPAVGALTPTAVALHRAARWAWQRIIRPRRAGSARVFYLVVANREVAAIELR